MVKPFSSKNLDMISDFWYTPYIGVMIETFFGVGIPSLCKMKEFLIVSAPERIKSLVRQFRLNIAQYKSPLYNETETRVEFLNPFWRELGWDMDNASGHAINYRDVIHEDSIKLRVGKEISNSKAPDYAFRIGGIRKFFLEAKKPAVDLKKDASPAYQLRCYGWSAGLPVSVLSDFEEFVVYNCRVKPIHTDSASVARIKYLNYTDYVDRWDEIADIFHRENILCGSFDQFVESKKSRAGTSEVDEEFLREIEGWREILAKDLAKNNPGLSVHDLNFAVQITIDRLLFLRMAEDRGIEPEDQLQNLLAAPNIYAQLLKIYQTADEKYNSGFFHFEEESDQSDVPDTLTPGLSFSDKPFREILSRLYPPKSPYRFDVFPVEILGNVYERFLGKVVRLTPARQVKVEEKPEVRKAGGVYYTPGYIVDYIVTNTVGRLCEGKTPAEVSRLKILDPACGSGSFLLGAYQFLKKWHLDYYIKEYERTGKIPTLPKAGSDGVTAGNQRGGGKKSKTPQNAIIQLSNTDWILSQAEKRRILLNNIYGVDIDAQAVEVTKLSLSLAVLEGANRESLHSELRLFYERALPNLASNIRCGNSLIGPDFYQNNPSLFDDDEEQLRLNAFDWNDKKHGFGTIMKSGGFDAVIGNPPWGQKECKFTNEEKQYMKHYYPNASVGILDFFRFFVEKSILLLNNTGVWGQVLPDIVLLKNYQTTRKYILNSIFLTEIDHWGKAFKNVNMEACTLIGTKKQRHSNIHITIHQDGVEHQKELSQNVFTTLPGFKFNLYLTSEAWKIISKLNSNRKFSDLFETHEGIHSGNVRKKLFISRKLNRQCKKLIFGRDEVKRYYLQWGGQWVHYSKSYFNNGDKAGLGKPEYFETPKLIIRRTGDFVLTCLDQENFYFSNNVFVCVPKEKDVNLFFYLGILNSRLLTWYYQTMQPRVGKMFAEIKINLINDFPIRAIDFSNPDDVRRHDKLVRSVEKMLALNKRLHEGDDGAANPRQGEMLERQISSLDREIDTLVYDLYDLTKEERELVENG